MELDDGVCRTRGCAVHALTRSLGDNSFVARWAPCERHIMPPSTVRPPFDQFLATADAVARERPEVDREMAREVFQEAATLLDNGLALEGLDEHDASAVVAGLCVDLVAVDSGAAIRARSKATLETPCDMHDPEAVSAAYLIAAAIFQL